MESNVEEASRNWPVRGGVKMLPAEVRDISSVRRSAISEVMTKCS